MWYLEAKTLLLICIFALFLFLLRLCPQKCFIQVRRIAVPAFSICFIFYFSRKLALFYFIYIIINFLLSCWILQWEKRRKAVFVFAVIGNVLLVSLFRFAAKDVFSVPHFNTVLMIGLSYTLLRMINLLFHVYLFEEPVKLTDIFSYILFIPTFTAGPIMLYREFTEEMKKPAEGDEKSLEYGVKRIILGFFKKIVMAQLLLSLYQLLIGGELNFALSFTVLLLYYLMGYFDFSGYSDIAVGFGSLTGIKVPENFKKPFSSPSLTQFWRNWHITLGNWARMHIFMPLSARITTPLRAGLISIVIFLFIGLWHGYNLSFFLWGLYLGIIIFMENILGVTTVNKKKVHPAYYLFRCTLTNIFVAFGEVFLISDKPDLLFKVLNGFTRW